MDGMVTGDVRGAYVAIDLKSFYASVECVERGLDPLRTNLVVADPSRTEKTICLAVSPPLKAYGIPGRPRLFEVEERVGRINFSRRAAAPRHRLLGESCDAVELSQHPELGLSFITAPPRMALYMEYSARIYGIYLKYIAPEDIHVYSVDEVFIDVAPYLKAYGMTPREITRMLISDVLKETGITGTAGIGTNLYLAKVAMDIVAKKAPPDGYGVRMAELDEHTYRRRLWDHRPLTDFWRIGRGYLTRLEQNGLYTMGDIARCSIGRPEDFYNEGLLYKMFGINAELLIDHAWGWEPCTMADIREYSPRSRSISSGQVLRKPYSADAARHIVREMADALALSLVKRGLVTDSLVLTVGYDPLNLKTAVPEDAYNRRVRTDRYGRGVPQHSHGTINCGSHTSSSRKIMELMAMLYDNIVDGRLLIRKITVGACRLRGAGINSVMDTSLSWNAVKAPLFVREGRVQQAVLKIKEKYGRNAIIKGMNLEADSTAIERNGQIGGHKA